MASVARSLWASRRIWSSTLKIYRTQLGGSTTNDCWKQPTMLDVPWIRIFLEPLLRRLRLLRSAIVGQEHGMELGAFGFDFDSISDRSPRSLLPERGLSSI